MAQNRMQTTTVKAEPPIAGFTHADWTKIEVTDKFYSETEKEANFRMRKGDGFLDIAITEYVGTSQRAKLTGMRLEKEAAEALLKMLQDHLNFL